MRIARLLPCLPALLVAASLHAQDAEPIRDNSFLIEEAYNQERGVVQHINAFSRDTRSGDWAYAFTQEWPFRSQHHQLSATIPVVRSAADRRSGLGDVALNYRYQALGVGGGAVSVSPRLSVVIPSGDSEQGFGTGAYGLQVNMPLSVELGSSLVTHWNAGAAFTPKARDAVGNRADIAAYTLGQSVVWLAHPLLNVLVETVWTKSESVAGPDMTSSGEALFVSPGLRGAINLESGLQIVPGVAVPFGVGTARGERALFAYLSFEHAF